MCARHSSSFNYSSRKENRECARSILQVFKKSLMDISDYHLAYITAEVDYEHGITTTVVDPTVALQFYGVKR